MALTLLKLLESHDYFFFKADMSITAPSIKPSQYRPDIDGLRAIAVLLVLIFHAGFDEISGGFVGVDVFFVISGYLITGILYRDISNHRFNFFEFMERRISRLYPALVTTLVISITLGFLIFSPQNYKTLAESSLSAFYSVSNIFFWKSAGYFDESSVTNPLLHTWSLAVEQQFYIFWPFVILVAYKTSSKNIPLFILLIGLISLLASQAMTSIEPSANYFLTPFRVFEFVAGGLLVWAERYSNKIEKYHDLTLMLGLGAIIFSGLTFSSSTPFPGFNALIPAVGAMLCISSKNAKYTGMVLRNKAMVSIGLVSYSIYLVHWPLIVFYKYYVYRPLGYGDKILLIISSIILSIPLYIFIEKKFRKSRFINKNIKKQSICFLIILGFTAIPYWIYKNEGLPDRINEVYAKRFSDPTAFHAKEYGGEGYKEGIYAIGNTDTEDVSGVFIGDSFSRQYAYSMDQALKASNRKWITAWKDGCFFREGYTRIRQGSLVAECQETLQSAINILKDHPEADLIVSMDWRGYANQAIASMDGEVVNLNASQYEEFIEETLRDFLELSTGRLIIIGSPPGSGSTLGIASCVQRPSYLPLPCLDLLSFGKENGRGYSLNRVMDAFAKSSKKAVFVDPAEALCDENGCHALGSEGGFNYSDSIHLSRLGAESVTKHFLDKLIIN